MISRRRIIFSLALCTALATPFFVGTGPHAQTQAPTTLRLPLKDGSIRFAVIGDTGRANRGQIEVGKQMAAFHKEFPFDFVIMAGDNIYGTDGPADMVAKFEAPYKPLLDAGVKFQRALATTTTRTSVSTSSSTWETSAITPSARPKGARCASLPSTATT